MATMTTSAQIRIEDDKSRAYAPPAAPTLRLAKKDRLHLPKDAEAVVEFFINRMFEHVGPAMGMSTREEIEEHWLKVYSSFADALAGYTTAIRESLPAELRSRETSSDHVDREFCEKVVALAGEGADEEIAFCMGTYARALRLVRKVDRELRPGVDPGTDRDCAGRFRGASTLHWFGMVGLCYAIADRGNRVTGPGVAFAFDALRQGALDAYRSIRQAVDLRISPNVDAPSISSDGWDFDHAIASLGDPA